MKRRIAIIALTTLCLLAFVPLSAQDPYLQRDNFTADKRANQLMRKYQSELGMTVEQALIFRNKVEEFVIRRINIQSEKLSAREKLRLLDALSDQETAEMANILTLPQLRAYRKIKKELQPLVVMVDEKEVEDEE
jgi:hypothetical protein